MRATIAVLLGCTGPVEVLPSVGECPKLSAQLPVSANPARLAFSPDQQRPALAVVTTDNRLEVFSLEQGNLLFEAPDVFYAAFTARGELLTTSPDPDRTGRRISRVDPWTQGGGTLTEDACFNAISADGRFLFFIDRCRTNTNGSFTAGRKGRLTVYQLPEFLILYSTPDVYATANEGPKLRVGGASLAFVQKVEPKSCEREGMAVGELTLLELPSANPRVLAEQAPAALYGYTAGGLLALGSTCPDPSAEFGLLDTAQDTLLGERAAAPFWFYGPQLSYHGPRFPTLGLTDSGLNDRAWTIQGPIASDAQNNQDGQVSIQRTLQPPITLENAKRALVLGKPEAPWGLYLDQENNAFRLDLRRPTPQPLAVLSNVRSEQRAPSGERVAFSTMQDELTVLDRAQRLATWAQARPLGFTRDDSLLYAQDAQLWRAAPPYDAPEPLDASFEPSDRPIVSAVSQEACAIAYGDGAGGLSVRPLAPR